MYVIKHERFEDLDTKPTKDSFYPSDWIPPTEEDYFNSTEKALMDKRFEQNYKNALEDWYQLLPNDWDVCNYGSNMNHLGFKKCLIEDTIYGCWSCSVYDFVSKNLIGRFSSDSGLVGVFLLSEILNYNPKWDLHLTKPYCACMIPNFQGKVSIINSGGISAGDCDVRIIGNGTLQFYSKQTGF